MPIEIYRQNYNPELAKEVSEGNQNTDRPNLMNSNESQRKQLIQHKQKTSGGYHVDANQAKG